MSLNIKSHYEIGESINDDPLVYVLEDYIKNEEVKHIIEAAQPQLRRAIVSAEKAGLQSAGRTGRNCWVSHHHDNVISAVSKRISDLVGIPLENAESLQVIHYNETQEYAPHYDAWDATTERGKRCMVKGGQRLVTCLLYLNDVEEGGGTCFPQLDLEVRAVKGRMVIFHNCDPGTNIRHPSSLHGGMPVLAGEKWACNFWFRERSYQSRPAPGFRKNSGSKKTRYKRVI